MHTYTLTAFDRFLLDASAVHMYIYTYIHICIHTYSQHLIAFCQTHLYIFTYICICVHIHTYMHTYILTAFDRFLPSAVLGGDCPAYVSKIYISIYAYVYPLCVCVCIYIYSDIYIYQYTHKCMHCMHAYIQYIHTFVGA